MNGRFRRFVLLGPVAMALLICGCGKPSASSGPSPEQAVARVQAAYSGADAETRQTIKNMSEAIEKGDYEQTVVSLVTIRSKAASTPEQQEAIIQSSRAIQANLLKAINAGDKNAERAYQLMKELKRD